MKQKQVLSSILMIMSVLACVFLSGGCDSPVIYSQYEVRLPEIPPDWEAVLGPPIWQIIWIDESGNWQKIEAQQNRSFSLAICSTNINPVIAYPYWPEKGILPEMLKPAGALFPLDTAGDTLNLDWQSGIDAQLYLYLARFNTDEARKPERFDWQRFRRLVRSEVEEEAIKANPWIVDWESAAKRIAASGFRSTYIKAQTYTEIPATIPESGIWISPSPFEEAKHWEAGETIILKATSSPSRLVSAAGSIVYTNKTWDYFKGRS